MDIKNVSILFFQKRIWSFGVLKSKGIENEMQKNSTSWHQWAWHCITIWECQLKSKVRQQTLESLVYTLSHIFLEDRRCKIYNSTDESLRIVAESKEDYNGLKNKI